MGFRKVLSLRLLRVVSVFILPTAVLFPFQSLLAQGVLRIGPAVKVNGNRVLASPPITFIYRDRIGLEIRREIIKFDPSMKEIKIPDGAMLVIGEKPPVNVSISGPPVDLVVEGGSHKIDIKGDHKVEILAGNIQLTVRGGEPQFKLGENCSAEVNVQAGSPLVRIGDAASRLEPGNQATFKIQQQDIVVEARKGSVTLINENGGTVVVQEKKVTTFDSKEVQTEKNIEAKATKEIAATEKEDEVVEGEVIEEEVIEQEEVIKEESKKEEVKNDEAKKEETKKEDTKKEEIKGEESSDDNDQTSPGPTVDTPITVIQQPTQPSIIDSSKGFLDQIDSSIGNSADEAQKQLDTKDENTKKEASPST